MIRSYISRLWFYILYESWKQNNKEGDARGGGGATWKKKKKEKKYVSR